MRALLILCLLCPLAACDNPEVRKTSELEGFRVLGLRTVPHVVELNAGVNRLNVELITFDAQDATVYDWTLCASLGALDRFACIPDTPTVSGQSTSTEWSIPFTQAALAVLANSATQSALESWAPPLCPDYELIGCDSANVCPTGAVCVDETCRSPTELYPIQLILRVQPMLGSDEGIPAALSIPIRAGSSNNSQVNALKLSVGDVGVEVPEDGGCGRVRLSEYPTGPMSVSLAVDSSSLDRFSSAVDGECIERSELEIGTVSWFAKGATLQKSISDLDEPTNELELDSDAELISIYGVVRDGRGSLDYVCAQVEFN